MSKLLPINITKAKVVKIALKFEENELKYSAEVDLISEFKKKVTSVYVGNDNYSGSEENADLPFEVIERAKDIRKDIEVAVIQFLNQKQKVLGGK